MAMHRSAARGFLRRERWSGERAFLGGASRHRTGHRYPVHAGGCRQRKLIKLIIAPWCACMHAARGDAAGGAATEGLAKVGLQSGLVEVM